MVEFGTICARWHCEYEFFLCQLDFFGEESPYLFLVCWPFPICWLLPSVRLPRDMVACPCACTVTYALFIMSLIRIRYRLLIFT